MFGWRRSTASGPSGAKSRRRHHSTADNPRGRVVDSWSARTVLRDAQERQHVVAGPGTGDLPSPVRVAVESPPAVLREDHVQEPREELSVPGNIRFLQQISGPLWRKLTDLYAIHHQRREVLTSAFAVVARWARTLGPRDRSIR